MVCGRSFGLEIKNLSTCMKGDLVKLAISLSSSAAPTTGVMVCSPIFCGKCCCEVLHCFCLELLIGFNRGGDGLRNIAELVYLVFTCCMIVCFVLVLVCIAHLIIEYVIQFS